MAWWEGTWHRTWSISDEIKRLKEIRHSGCLDLWVGLSRVSAENIEEEAWIATVILKASEWIQVCLVKPITVDRTGKPVAQTSSSEYLKCLLKLKKNHRKIWRQDY